MQSIEIDVKAIRQAHEMTQQGLADRLGVNLSTVWRWENGGTIPGPVKAYLETLASAPTRKPKPSREGIGAS